MITTRELIGLIVAAFVGIIAFAIAGAAITGFKRGPSSLEEVKGLFVIALWFMGPLVLLSTAIVAPVVLFLRRCHLLNIWSSVGLFAACPIAITLVEIAVDPGDFLPLSDGILWRAAAEYLSFGLAAGITYWAIVMLPSNRALKTDAKRPQRAA